MQGPFDHFSSAEMMEEYLVPKGKVRPVLSDHIKQNIFLSFQTVGCLMQHESRAHFSFSNSHLSILISM